MVWISRHSLSFGKRIAMTTLTSCLILEFRHTASIFGFARIVSVGALSYTAQGWNRSHLDLEGTHWCGQIASWKQTDEH